MSLLNVSDNTLQYVMNNR